MSLYLVGSCYDAVQIKRNKQASFVSTVFLYHFILQFFLLIDPVCRDLVQVLQSDNFSKIVFIPYPDVQNQIQRENEWIGYHKQDRLYRFRKTFDPGNDLIR